MNMSYCRFENTVGDMEDCLDHILDEDLSESENKSRERLIDICYDIIAELESVGIER